ncbi:probable Aromatic/aminoadipate aminotransferase 1 [Saccharomycodes ludwigii]|uniref:aromatic-amino-acid transaminase n=1 Tax=Saccharomycodes ludwigii TaxID=36035 RepID=A0A376B3Q3_9ASCO|nr:hypothetical protein SCDLUD_002357 [Saccharomycodes ludwigii]KAH3900898.1 hypothetical protein SCDLUD_002357 [Saccharomycodes ludwigii]SSD59114.1 probable Aromatic/aminoadipate aminotransferase 1 [Saccharomycodes ludwigii]
MTLPESKDFSYLFSDEAKSRKPSPLKTCIHLFNDPNIIFLGGGLPLSNYFPWKEISAISPKPPFPNGIGAPIKNADEEAIEYIIPKAKAEIREEGDIPLERCLQYGFSQGQPELLKFLRKHTEVIHKMDKYSDWDVLATIGNTGGWESCLRVFCNRGDNILAEAHSFSSSLSAALSQGVNVFPIPMDEFGIIPSKLEFILDNWNEKAPKPKLLYTIPTGQNPTGSSLSDERKFEIYQLAKKHDFIIVEDEPYYFLQMGKYESPETRSSVEKKPTHEEFVNGLAKSFVSLDDEGRVLRLDSFSKVLAPGTRLGWIVGSKKLLTTFLYLHEMTIQAPAGFTQTLVSKTLNSWGQDGYLDWLIGLRHEYTVKRDTAIDALRQHLPVDIRDKTTNEPLVVVNPPVAGMFFVINIDASQHPKFNTEFNKDPKKVEKAFYEKVIQKGVLVVPGGWFETTGETVPPQPKESKVVLKPNEIFFRGTYAAVPLDKMKEGIKRLGVALREEFGL